MEATRFHNKHQATGTPTELSSIGVIAGKWVPMRVESIGPDELFVVSKEYVRPRSVFEILIWLPSHDEPLHAMLTASFVERSWNGFGIGARIAAISNSNRARWSDLSERAACARPPGESVALRRSSCKTSVVVVDQSLPIGVIDELVDRGLDIETVQTPEEALRLAVQGGVDLVVSRLASSDDDGLALCRSLARLPLPPQCMLITHRGTASDFESALYAGATKVIARPCGQIILVLRILELSGGRRPFSAMTDVEADDDDFEAALPHRSSLLERLSGPFSAWWMNARRYFRSSAVTRSLGSHRRHPWTA